MINLVRIFGLPHLSGREGHFLRVEVQQTPEVHEETLRRLRTEISHVRALRPDGRLSQNIHMIYIYKDIGTKTKLKR